MMSASLIRVNCLYTSFISPDGVCGLFLIKEWAFGNHTASLHPVTTPMLACVAMQLQETRDWKCTRSFLPDTDIQSLSILQGLRTGYRSWGNMRPLLYTEIVRRKFYSKQNETSNKCHYSICAVCACLCGVWHACDLIVQSLQTSRWQSKGCFIYSVNLS